MSGDGVWFDALFEDATHELYARNAFRVSGAGVDASSKEVRKRLGVIKKAQGLGMESPLPSGPLPLERRLTPQDSADVIQRLGDPECRLIDELFWFWPEDFEEPGSDEAFVAAQGGDFAKAVLKWTERESSGRSGTATHNLAVYSHALALDIEAQGREARLPSGSAGTRDQHWAHALARWRMVIDDEDLWSQVKARVQALEERRLTTGAVRRLRHTLPVAILAINAGLAVEAVGNGRDRTSSRHLKLIRESGFPEDAVSEALGRLAGPVRRRVRRLCDVAKDRSEADPAGAAAVGTELLDQAEPLLKVIDALLDEDDAVREKAHDDVATRALTCQVVYARETDDWDTSLELLERAGKLARGRAAVERMKENIRIVKGNREHSRLFGRCWFCGEGEPDESAEVVVKMHGEVTREPTFMGINLKWKNVTIKVPRCSGCKAAHNSLKGPFGLLFVGAGMLIAYLFFMALATGDAVCVALAVVMVIAAVAGLQRYRATRQASASASSADVKPYHSYREFPPVKEKAAKGWKPGERPAEARGG